MIRPTHDDILYAAGYFDAGGSVGIYGKDVGRKDGRKYYYLNIKLAQKTDPVLLWIQERWGGSIYVGKTAISLDLSTGNSRRFLMHVQPYLIYKRPIVDYILGVSGLFTREHYETVRQMKGTM